MHHEQLADEDAYLRQRADQWLHQAGRTRGLTRRQVLRLAAIGLPMLTGAEPLLAGDAEAAEAADPPIQKPEGHRNPRSST